MFKQTYFFTDFSLQLSTKLTIKTHMFGKDVQQCQRW